MPPAWVFLDRDGTVNVPAPPGDYVTRAADLALLPGAGAAVARLNRAGIWVGVVTNQRAVSLGVMTGADLASVNERLRELLAGHGAHIDGIWVCPHALGACDCRKPRPGLLLQAQRAVPEIAFTRAAMVGDSEADVAAGRAVGATTVRLGDELGDADLLAADLAEAVELLLRS